MQDDGRKVQGLSIIKSRGKEFFRVWIPRPVAEKLPKDAAFECELTKAGDLLFRRVDPATVVAVSPARAKAKAKGGSKPKAKGARKAIAKPAAAAEGAAKANGERQGQAQEAAPAS